MGLFTDPSYLVQEPVVSAKVQQASVSDPFSLQSKQLQPDYVSSHNASIIQDIIYQCNAEERRGFVP